MLNRNFPFAAMVFGALFMLLSCSTKNTVNRTDPLVAHIDTSVKPGNDFFDYANGKWLKDHKIPASESYIGIFQIVHDTIDAEVHDICVSAAKAKDEKKGSDKQKIGDFYYSGMDSVSLNKKGISELKNDLEKIDDIKNTDQLIGMSAYIHKVSGSPMFAFGVGQDDKLSDKNAVFIWQGGLSLPDRSYYFDKDGRADTIRIKFVKHLKKMFMRLGYNKAAAGRSAKSVMQLETAIAKVSRKREETRIAEKNYNKMGFDQLLKLTPAIDWPLFTKDVGLNNVDTVIVGQPEFITALNGYLKSFPLSVWKDYLKYHYIRGLASYMDDSTYMDVFRFYGTVLRGIEKPRPRWKRVTNRTNYSLGDLVGKVYVKEYLPRGTKEKLLEIGNSIKSVYAERIKHLDWMSEATKERALKKLDAMNMKLGYPDHWKDMSSLQVDRSSYVKNVMRANLWHYEYMISKYGKPVDRTEWDMEPQTYNAYYSTSNNEIVIPGCNIIVPGYERKMADDAVLYGIIGATFGHEITHGFDDQGSKYDAKGNLHNWWTTQDSIKFYAKTRKIVKQYDNYIAVDSLHINGKMTQGENIADLGGVTMAFVAFKKTPQYKNNKMIDGFTPAQRFFLGYALGWMLKERPETIANQVKSDVHSPEKFRVNGPLSDMPEFYKAFDVKPGDAMWRPDSLRVKIW